MSPTPCSASSGHSASAEAPGGRSTRYSAPSVDRLIGASSSTRRAAREPGSATTCSHEMQNGASAIPVTVSGGPSAGWTWEPIPAEIRSASDGEMSTSSGRMGARPASSFASWRCSGSRGSATTI